jgi:hypothetical protein
MVTQNSAISSLKQIEETLWKAADKLRNNLRGVRPARTRRPRQLPLARV